MVKFKDEQGNIVTPRLHDYVTADDITSCALESGQTENDVHNAVLDAFMKAGCICDPMYGGFGDHKRPLERDWDCISWYRKRIAWGYSNDEFEAKRRIIPCQQTLFEAAINAPDGAQFRIDATVFNKCREMSREWTLVNNYGKHAEMHYLERTDFEQLPAEPKKRDVKMTPIYGVKVPSDMTRTLREKFELIGRLMQWEGAQIGEPGWAFNKPEPDKPFYLECACSPIDVTFQNPEQCTAAWQAVFPELFEVKP